MRSKRSVISMPFVCVLAGGFGTRLAVLKGDKPKTLMPAWEGEKWVFVNLLCYSLAKSGFNKFDLIFCPNEGWGEQIEGYLLNDWLRERLDPVLSKTSLVLTKEQKLRGTGRAIYQSIVENHFHDKDIIMTPVDTFLPGKEIKKAVVQHRRLHAIMTFLVTSKTEK